MALESLRFTGNGTLSGTTVETADSSETILNVTAARVFAQSTAVGAVVVNDVGLDITRSSGIDKCLLVTSDGTLAGTTVSTADDNTEINNVESIDINIGSNGISAVVKCSSVEVALNT